MVGTPVVPSAGLKAVPTAVRWAVHWVEKSADPSVAKMEDSKAVPKAVPMAEN